METKFGGFIEHWRIVVLKLLNENLSTNFGLIAVFMKVAFEIKELNTTFYPDSHVFLFLEIRQVDLRLAGCRVQKGHIHLKTNKWSETSKK